MKLGSERSHATASLKQEKLSKKPSLKNPAVTIEPLDDCPAYNNKAVYKQIIVTQVSYIMHFH